MTVLFTIQTIFEILIAVAILYSIACEDKALAFINSIIEKINTKIEFFKKAKKTAKREHFYKTKADKLSSVNKKSAA